jgi:ficolin
MYTVSKCCISHKSISRIFQVYCDMETDGGGWVVFQRRMNGAVDFYRPWANYLKGFGDLNGEFWLGLHSIHRLTLAANTTLRVDLADFEGEQRHANYSTFRVLDSSRKYTLIIGGYSGDAGDGMARQNGMNFTTYDEDNDRGQGNCALAYKGAWWYNYCHHSNLNGRYLSGHHTSYANGVNWRYWRGNYYSLKTTEMKLR